ncbi:MAG: class II aldolase/adducin family protein [Sphaerochaetaceae bacterium]|nr:class II aldolase/adducin family protein [Sphaerochaetaceae bacterium]
MDYREIREEIVSYSKQMYSEKLVTATSGNISVRLPDRQNAFAITPSSENYMSLTEERIVIVTIDGEILSAAPGARPSSEWRLHAELYRAKKEVNAVVHTHSPYATAFAVIREKIPLILIEMKVFLNGEVPLSPYAPNGTQEVAENVSRSIGEHGACLMENHGVVCVGKDLKSAYIRAAYTEDAARVCYMAKTMGKPVTIL